MAEQILSRLGSKRGLPEEPLSEEPLPQEPLLEEPEPEEPVPLLDVPLPEVHRWKSHYRMNRWNSGTALTGKP